MAQLRCNAGQLRTQHSDNHSGFYPDTLLPCCNSVRWSTAIAAGSWLNELSARSSMNDGRTVRQRGLAKADEEKSPPLL